MKNIKVFHYDAFSKIKNKGNPAGVVLNANNLSENEMQNIAHNVGFNETVFVIDSEKADLRLRYFTPGHEINLCGHATMGALYCLKSRGFLDGRDSIKIETNVGILPIDFEDKEDQIIVRMKQDNPKFVSFNGDIKKLAASMGLTEEDIDLSEPTVYGSTGIWTLLVPIKDLRSFSIMKPNNEQFPDILIENRKSSVHPFCFDTYDDTTFMHARHFSSPYSGTKEDAVTGTASGVVGAYYLSYINKDMESIAFVVEQGQEIDKDGRVSVEVYRNTEILEVFISGAAVFVKEFEVEYA
ncbi:PhzF family phenazine biosynthesis protein [Caldalkalibacillus mannanilyticus]|uniref:PhzF family phenazine biosynthesis protein n=1 Tax=Caldalkalibacillus mannanilyticus TaxID=1418 RepID=UPI00046AFC9D|nr:PhzF family phenazine biosynthesis isomerase [Caldalkalibacillus mannanilyticus]